MLCKLSADYCGAKRRYKIGENREERSQKSKIAEEKSCENAQLPVVGHKQDHQELVDERRNY